MAIELINKEYPIRRHLEGSDSFFLDDSSRVKITAGETTILNEKVPNGKRWQVYVDIKIDESDA